MNIGIEVVIFKSKADVSDSQLKTAALAVTPILKDMPNFISREFGVSENGNYIDVVHWTDLPSAKAAAEKVMRSRSVGSSLVS